jgi:integrase
METNLAVMPKPKKEGKPRRARGEGGLFRMAGSKVWWTKINGTRQSTGTRIKGEALEVLRKRQGRDLLGIADPADLRRITYEDARAALIADYKNNERASLKTLIDGTLTVDGMKYVDKFFSGRPVVDISRDVVQSFIESRRRDGAAPATINRNTALLHRMLELLALGNQHLHIPEFQKLREPKARQGFCEREDFAKLFDAIGTTDTPNPELLQTFILFLYTTGCRTGEAKSLRWNQVDLNERIIRVEDEQTKNDEPREIPLADDVYDRLKKIPESKRVGLLFPVGNFRKAWQSACVKAGLGTLTPGPMNGNYGTYEGLIPHDFRRSAVRNLRKAGVAEGVAMKVSGHKTREVFERYNIVTSDDTKEAVRRVPSAPGSSSGQVRRASRARSAK